MIRIEIFNDTTGTVERGNYDVFLILPGTYVAEKRRVRVEGFDRSRGWAELAREAIERLEQA